MIGTVEPSSKPSPSGRTPGRLVAGFRPARIASWACLGVAAALAGLFVVQIGMFEAAAPPRPGSQAANPESDQIIVTGSSFTGFDREEQPYAVTAATAIQNNADPDRLHLERVTGELRKRSGEIVNLVARTALYDSKAKTLDLAGAVRLMSVDRFVADMERAQVTLSDKRLRSEEEVVVTFSRGEITAGGVEITDDGKRIVFFNGAKAIFRPAANKEDIQQ